MNIVEFILPHTFWEVSVISNSLEFIVSLSLHYLYTLTPRWLYWLHISSIIRINKIFLSGSQWHSVVLVNFIQFSTIDLHSSLFMTIPGWIYLTIIGNRVNRVHLFFYLLQQKGVFTKQPMLLAVFSPSKFRFINFNLHTGPPIWFGWSML